MVDDPSSHPEIFRTEKAQERERQRLDSNKTPGVKPDFTGWIPVFTGRRLPS
jgi:hypothetical protein